MRPVVALPTPEQIAEQPELVALYALAHGLGLAARALVGAYPNLDDPEVPHWAIDPSRARRAAHHLVMAASHLQSRIDEYLAALELDRQDYAESISDDLPF
jgi:hypothetical protein